jgi:acyl-CoA thioester hydrolase
MILITHRLQVRFRDCDPLGHVNNAVYMTYLEQARFNLWKAQMGFQARSASDPGPRGVGFILARVEFDYRAQAKYGDMLDIKLSLGDFGRTSFTYTYEIVDAGSGALIATAKTVLVRFDYDAQKPALLDDEAKAKLSTVIS